MRAREFLLEYRRDVTAQAMGDKLLQTLAATKPFNLPDSLYGMHTIIDMALRPEWYRSGQSSIALNVGGQTVNNVSIETAMNILQENKAKFIDAILAYIEAHDPTQNKAYTQWLARTWINAGGEAKLEDMNRGNFLVAYTRGKQRRLISPEHADINRFKTYKEFENVLLQKYNLDELFGDPSQQAIARGQAEDVYKTPNVRVVVPKDQTAACYYGQGTQWCTAATRGINRFEQYARTGDLYILIPTKAHYEGEKYQLHFKSNSFMNEEDEPVPLAFILNKRFPDLKEFFLKTEPLLQEYVVFANQAVLNKIGREFGDIANSIATETVGVWMDHDDYFKEWQAEEAINRGYVDEEGNIDWDLVNDDESLTNYYEWNDEAREFIDDIENAATLSPSEARELAEEIEMEDGDTISIASFDRLVSYNIIKTLGKHNDHGLADFIERYYGVEKNADGEWRVKQYRWR